MTKRDQRGTLTKVLKKMVIKQEDGRQHNPYEMPSYNYLEGQLMDKLVNCLEQGIRYRICKHTWHVLLLRWYLVYFCLSFTNQIYVYEQLQRTTVRSFADDTRLI